MELKDMFLGASAGVTVVVSGVYYGRDYIFYRESYDIASGKFKVEADAIMASRMVIIDSLEDAISHKDKILKYVNKDSYAAQVGEYVSIRITDNQYIHIKNCDLSKVRKEILGDDRDYKYEVSFKNAEYHAYSTVRNLETNVEMHIGVSVKPIGAWHGDVFVRDDSAYDEKYFRGHDVESKGESNHKRDKGSYEIKFLITDEQLTRLEEKVKKDDENFGGLSSNGQYRFIDGNCIDYAYSMYKAIGFPTHYYHFANSNELDFNDQGVLYNLWLAQKYDVNSFLRISSDHGSMIWKIPAALYTAYTAPTPFLEIANHHRYLESMPKFLRDWYFDTPSISKIQALLDGDEQKIKEVDAQDERGDTPLHIALKLKDIYAATKILGYGADVNIPNGRGDTALHLAAGLPKSQAKLDLLKLIIEKAKDINVEDKYSDDIPLTCAAKANDPEAMELLISHGADIHFVNNNKDHIINVLAESMRVDPSDANFMATDYIWEHDKDQFYYDNGNRHYAVHHPNFHGRYEVREGDHPEKKTDEELYCYYNNFSEKFAELRAGADEMHKEPQDY